MGAGREVLDSSPWIGSTPEGGALIQSSILCYLSSFAARHSLHHDHYCTLRPPNLPPNTGGPQIPCGVDGLEGHDVGSDVD